MEACEGLNPGRCWRLITVNMSMSEHGPKGTGEPPDCHGRPYCSHGAGSHCGSSFYHQQHLPQTERSSHPTPHSCGGGG